MRKKVIMYSDINHCNAHIEEMTIPKQKSYTTHLEKNTHLKLYSNGKNVIKHLKALINPKGDHSIHHAGYFKS